MASAQIFAGVTIELSRFSYLVSLLPEQIIDDLGLELELRSRRVASYTPVGDGGLLVERQPGGATRDSFETGPGLAAYQQLAGSGNRPSPARRRRRTDPDRTAAPRC